jgi:hypothetical protein
MVVGFTTVSVWYRVRAIRFIVVVNVIAGANPNTIRKSAVASY